MAAMGLSTREYGGHVVVALDGELDVAGAESVMAVLAAAVARDPRIIVDLVALEFIDCCALGALGRVRAQARQAGGDLLLAAPRGPVRRILAPTGLIDVFSVYASVTARKPATRSPSAWNQDRPGCGSRAPGPAAAAQGRPGRGFGTGPPRQPGPRRIVARRPWAAP